MYLCKLTDAGNDNWEFSDSLPEGPMILDFFHATEHLAAAIAAIRGDGTMATRHKVESPPERLLLEDDGVEAVIYALAHLKRKHPTTKRVAEVLNYFRKNRHRMRYAKWKREGSRPQDARRSALSPTLATHLVTAEELEAVRGEVTRLDARRRPRRERARGDRTRGGAQRRPSVASSTS